MWFFLSKSQLGRQHSNPGCLPSDDTLNSCMILMLEKQPAAAAAAKSLQSCPTLCEPIDGSPPGSLVPGILQARTLERVAISFSNAWKESESEVAQLCLTLSNPMDCSPPGSSVLGIFQARLLEWFAISFSNLGSHFFIYKMWRKYFTKSWQVKHCV